MANMTKTLTRQVKKNIKVSFAQMLDSDSFTEMIADAVVDAVQKTMFLKYKYETTDKEDGGVFTSGANVPASNHTGGLSSQQIADIDIGESDSGENNSSLAEDIAWGDS